MRAIAGALNDCTLQGELEDCIEDLMVSWFAYQNESLLAAQALVETIIAAHRSGWSVERVNMELSFLSLKKQDIAGQQIGALDNDMLLSFVAVGIYTCQVCFAMHSTIWHCQDSFRPGLSPST